MTAVAVVIWTMAVASSSATYQSPTADGAISTADAITRLSPPASESKYQDILSVPAPTASVISIAMK
jgi:hypothetical protein